jgi:hypothetical protein
MALLSTQKTPAELISDMIRRETAFTEQQE